MSSIAGAGRRVSSGTGAFQDTAVNALRSTDSHDRGPAQGGRRVAVVVDHSDGHLPACPRRLQCGPRRLLRGLQGEGCALVGIGVPAADAVSAATVRTSEPMTCSTDPRRGPGRPRRLAPVADRLMSRLRDPRPALTPRERDILAQLAQGLPDHAIARARCVGEAAVETRPYQQGMEHAQFTLGHECRTAVSLFPTDHPADNA
ncbi:hypothetical protein ACL07V_32080 [Streptomyces sp. MB22_4]|uniref:hypothetical protein n=1 Tax=Streptomyces sp. MB22_4 TaxID=3383120 RepID=UPI00399EFEBC